MNDKGPDHDNSLSIRRMAEATRAVGDAFDGFAAPREQPELTAEQALGVALSVAVPTMLMFECQEAAPAMLEHLRRMGYELRVLSGGTE